MSNSTLHTTTYVLVLALILIIPYSVLYYRRKTYVTTQNQASSQPAAPQLDSLPHLNAEEHYSTQLIQDALSHTETFTSDNYLATPLSSAFLKDGARIWLIMRSPTVKNKPDIALGTFDGKAYLLPTPELVVKFYNLALIPPSTSLQSISLLEEILRVALYRDEFGYDNNTTEGRGYRVISSMSDMGRPMNTLQPVTYPITPPQATLLKKANYEASLWIWGKHNCEVHHATLSIHRDYISNISVTNEGNYGICEQLFYE